MHKNKVCSKVVECIDATVSNLRQLDVDPADVLAVGLSTVRSTTFAWDRVTGASLCSEVRDDNEGLQDVADSLLKARRNLSPDHVKTLSGLPVNGNFPAVKFR